MSDAGVRPADASVDGSIDAGIDASIDAALIDAGTGTGDAAAPVRLTACLDRPEQLPMPPSGQLPCELLPPGLSL
ncbi:MAG TPA: hypothetical protein VG963_18515 [Polyangiaceae bacterium]|nr:hypothetical protein [Polyangiaceae bacterium]